MIYDWFLIFNLTEFEALGLVSKLYTIELEDVGEKDILVVMGNNPGMIYEDIFLSLNMNDENPFAFEDHAIYLNEDTQDVYLGILVDES